MSSKVELKWLYHELDQLLNHTNRSSWGTLVGTGVVFVLFYVYFLMSIPNDFDIGPHMRASILFWLGIVGGHCFGVGAAYFLFLRKLRRIIEFNKSEWGPK